MPANTTSVFDSMPPVGSSEFDLCIDVTSPKVAAAVAQVSPSAPVPLPPLNENRTLTTIDLNTPSAASVFDYDYISPTNSNVVNPIFVPSSQVTTSKVPSEPTSSFTLENCLTAAGIFLAVGALFTIGVAIEAALSLAAGILIPTAIGLIGLWILSKKFPDLKPIFDWVWEQLQKLRASKPVEKQTDVELLPVRFTAAQLQTTGDN